MRIMLGGVRVDHDRGAVTVATSPQEINRITNALWQLMHDAPPKIELKSVVGVSPERVHSLAGKPEKISTSSLINTTSHDR